MSHSVAIEMIPTVCWCGIAYEIPKNLDDHAHETADDPTKKALGVYCPLGHVWVYNSSTEVKRLRDELTRTRAQLDQAHARANDTYGRLARTERKLKRVAKGTCPECKRHFVNLARHMKSKHVSQKETP